jgi:replicative DNA helicase
MLQLLHGMSTQEQGPCLVWSQEMKRPALLNRMNSRLTGISVNRFRQKKLDPDEWKRMEESYSHLEQLPILIADAKNVTIQEIRSTVKQAKRKYGKISGIFVDYLGIMNIPQPVGMTRAQAIGDVTKRAKQIAMELDCPFILLAQMNREGKKAIKPSLEHLRESGDLEQDADVVEFLWENPEDVDPGPIHLGSKVIQSIIAKGRDIGVNEFRYLFKGWIQQFEEI